MGSIRFKMTMLLLTFSVSNSKREQTKSGIIFWSVSAEAKFENSQSSRTESGTYSKTANTYLFTDNKMNGSQPRSNDKATFTKGPKRFPPLGRPGAAPHFQQGYDQHRPHRMELGIAKAATPKIKRLPSGLWNCSVPNWSTLAGHSRCNLTTECAGGEDELDCPYSGQCGTGYLTIDGRCYLYVADDNRVSWVNADQACQRRGGRLASLNTKEEWDRVMEVTNMASLPMAFWVGLRETLPTLLQYYRGTYIWVDQTIAYYIKTRNRPSLDYSKCGKVVRVLGNIIAFFDYCVEPTTRDYLCELDKGTVKGTAVNSRKRMTPSKVKFSNMAQVSPRSPVFLMLTTRCPRGHVTLQFLACDSLTDCWAVQGRVWDDVVSSPKDMPTFFSCPAPMTSLPPSFTCRENHQAVAYTLVCDHRPDCLDGSDEDFCVHPHCLDGAVQCHSSQQCISRSQLCDGQIDCHGASEETSCQRIHERIHRWPNITPPVVIDFNALQWRDDLPVKFTADCPETYVQCADEGYCLPVYTRCNGVYDCPDHEDEADCATYTCPGFYRCRGTTECLHADHVCDGLYQCPQKDDELYCHLTCPDNCTCHGLAYICRGWFPADEYRDVRYLDASGSGLTPDQLANNTLLIFLSLANCGMRYFHSLTFVNLHMLDVSDNLVGDVTTRQMNLLINLRILLLYRNPLTYDAIFSDASSFVIFKHMQFLDLSRTDISELRPVMFLSFPNLQKLNVSHSGVVRSRVKSLKHVGKLSELDTRGCPMTYFPSDLLKGLGDLREVYADNYKLCCPATLPEGFNPKNCHAPSGDVSSCEALLQSTAYRVLLSLFATLSLTGNLFTFTVRLIWMKETGKSGFSVMVTHLCLSDFLMGVYLTTIGVADRIYLGTYLWEDIQWRYSVACKTVGFLSFLSSEMSAFIVSFITLDRFLALRFPLSRLNLSKGTATVTCVSAWAGCMVIAAVPFLGNNADWNFYSQTGICFPMPITGDDFRGHDYAFGIIIIFNFIVFLFIAVGQASIFFAVRANRMNLGDRPRKSRDLKIARRLITIAVSDFVCWFPIGLLGLLASRGAAVPGEVNVAMGIIVLPLNSALNPFLYNLNVVLEKWRKKEERKLMKVKEKMY